MKKYPVLSDTLVLIVELIFIVGIGTVLGINLYAVKNSEIDTADVASEDLMNSLPDIEKASDEKSIVNAKTKEVILTIDEAQAYLEQSGLAYDSETFMTTDAKYAGNSFNQIAVSNDRQKMVFSTYGLAGDMPQPWIGIYELVITDSLCASGDRAGIIPSASACIGEEPEWQVRFLTGGGGVNFVWSQDDKTISYEADFRAESGLDKMIDVSTGEVTITEDCEEYNEKFFTSKDDCYEWIARANEDGSSYNDLTDQTIEITFPNDQQKLFVCGRNYQIAWTPINPENPVDIKIYNNCENCTSRGIVWQKLGVENSGTYDFYVPFSISTGDGHQIEITESSDDGVYTGQSVEFVIAD